MIVEEEENGLRDKIFDDETEESSNRNVEGQNSKVAEDTDQIVALHYNERKEAKFNEKYVIFNKQTYYCFMDRFSTTCQFYPPPIKATRTEKKR